MRLLPLSLLNSLTFLESVFLCLCDFSPAGRLQGVFLFLSYTRRQGKRPSGEKGPFISFKVGLDMNIRYGGNQTHRR